MAVIIAIAVTVVGGCCLWYRSQGPRYQGRTVAQWIAAAGRGEDLHTNGALRAMLATLGTNAIPPLMEILEPKNSMVTRACRQISQMNGLPKSIRDSASARLDRNQHRAVAAAGAIRLLWTNAEPAIPDLERLAQDRSTPLGGGAALWALTGLGKHAGPAIARLKSNAPPARAVLILAMMEQSWSVMLRHENQSQREEAALSLSWSAANAFAAIPILEAMRESDDAEKREAAMRALSRLAKYHGAARDALRLATNSIYSDTRQTAKTAHDQFNNIERLKTFD